MKEAYLQGIRCQSVLAVSTTLNSQAHNHAFVQSLYWSRRIRAKLATVALLALALLVIAIPSDSQPAPTAPFSTPGSPQESLVFTVNPDKSVDVGMTTSTSLPVSGVSGLLTSGYKVHSSSNFTQLANAVIENTTITYQIPPVLSSSINSISFTAAQYGLVSEGALRITTTLPVQSVGLVYSTTSIKIQVNATAQLVLGCSPACFGPLANQTSWSQAWSKTFANTTWTNMIKTQIYNSTQHALTVTTFSGTEIDSPTSANVSIYFAAIPTGPSADFIKAIENIYFPGGTIPPSLDAIIQSALALSTGQSASLSYNQSTGTIIIKARATFVSNLDAQVNTLKSRLFQYLFSLPITPPPSELFLNATTVTISKISTTSDFDLATGTSSSTLTGLIINPLTEGSSTDFTIHGLFQTLGSMSFSPNGVTITLAGGSNSTYQVKVVVPSGTPTPSSTTSNSATWSNVQNATSLQNVEFQLEKPTSSIFTFFTTPIGFAVDAIIAAAVIGAVLVLLRRKRTKMPTSLPTSGPTSTPGIGPSPAPPTP